LAKLDGETQAYRTQVDTLRAEVQRLATNNSCMDQQAVEVLLSQWAADLTATIDAKLATLPASSQQDEDGAGNGQRPPIRKRPLVVGNNRAFVAALRDANNRLIVAHEETNLFNLRAELVKEIPDITVEAIKAVIEELKEQRINKLKPNQEIQHDALLDGVSLT